MLASLGAATLLLSACGGGSPTPSVAHVGTTSTGTSTTATSTGSSTRGLLAFAQCMRSHGLSNFPDPSTRAGGGQGLTITKDNGLDPTSPRFQHAQHACGRLLPAGRTSPAASQAAKSAMLHFSQCMRSHGEPTFPDPKFSSTGGLVAVGLDLNGSGIDPNSQRFQHAQHACTSILGARAGFFTSRAP